MSKKHHAPGPVPAGNQPQAGPAFGNDQPDVNEATKDDANTGASFQDQDVQRRLGQFSGAGEHPRQQPGRLNDGDVHSR